MTVSLAPKMTLAFHLHAPNGLSRHTLGCFPRAHTTGRKILATCQPSGLTLGLTNRRRKAFCLDTRSGKLGHCAWNLFRPGGLYFPALGYSIAGGGGTDRPTPQVTCRASKLERPQRNCAALGPFL